jgi:hypothetical protein
LTGHALGINFIAMAVQEIWAETLSIVQTEGQGGPGISLTVYTPSDVITTGAMSIANVGFEEDVFFLAAGISQVDIPGYGPYFFDDVRDTTIHYPLNSVTFVFVGGPVLKAWTYSATIVMALSDP